MEATRDFTPAEHPPTMSLDPKSGQPIDATRSLDPSTGHPTDATRTIEGAEQPKSRGHRAVPPGYELETEIGRGGMGVVYKARQISLNRPTAIKMIIEGDRASEKQIIRFLAEAESVAAIHHPHVVQVYEFGEYQGCLFLALEYLPNGRLTDQLTDHKQMSAREAAELIRKLAEGVQAAHQMGIVHRDLKPSNILFDEHNEPKITDFGLAKRAAGSDVTATFAVMGTPAYMSPEQARGETRFVGPSTDIYSLGAILYECLLGHRAFESEDALSVLKQVSESDIGPLRKQRRDLPRDLDLIRRKCMEKSPHRRYETAKELAEDLNRYLTGEPVKARPLPLHEQGLRWVRRHPATAAVAAMVMVFLGVSFVATKLHASKLAGMNAQLETALDESDRQRRDAEAARNLAAGQLKQRESTFHQLLDGFDVRLENLDGAKTVHREFLGEMALNAQSLLDASPNDPEAMRRAASIYLKAAGAANRQQDFAAADRKFANAASLYEALAERSPNDATREAHAECLHKWGRAHIAAGRREAAATRLGQAAAAYDKLSAGNSSAAVKTARALYHQAEATALAQSAAAAVPIYRYALERQAALKKQEAGNVDLLEDYGLTLSGLALALQESDPKAAIETHRQAIAAHREALALVKKSTDSATAADTGRSYDKLPKELTKQVQDAFHDLGNFLEERKLADELAALGRDYNKQMPPEKEGSREYDAACFLSLAAGIAKAAGRDDQAKKFGAEACGLFHDAVAGGFSDRVHMQLDTDLDPIRNEAAFKAAVKELDAGYGNAVVSREMVDTLETYHQSWMEKQDDVKSSKLTYTAHRRASRGGVAFEQLAEYALAAAKKKTTALTALPLLAWVVEAANKTAPRTAGGKVAGLKRTAIEGLQQHVRKAEFGAYCKNLAKAGDADLDEVFAKAASELGLPTEKSRALAAYYLASSKARQAELAPSGSTEQVRLLDEAGKAFEAAAGEYGNVDFTDSEGRTTKMKTYCDNRRYEVMNLYPGRMAPAFKGVGLRGGESVSLEQYRGKVVLVSFWTQWCGICRGLFPVHKQLLSDYTGQPFAILGVNAEGDREVAERAVVGNAMNWPSLYDGRDGPICRQYKVDGYPNFYLLDASGRIRWRSLGRPHDGELEKAVADLLQEMQAKK